MERKAILVAAFGTTYPAARQKAIDSIVNKIKEAFGDFETRLTFTAETVVRKLWERDSIKIPTPSEALEDLKNQGFREVIVQPLHIIPGLEWKKLLSAVRSFRESFESISLGRPLLYFAKTEKSPDDFEEAAKALLSSLPRKEKQHAVILMAHGSWDPANACYFSLEWTLRNLGAQEIYLAAVEGCPSLDQAISQLESNNITRVTLVPFMLVAGEHVYRDLASDEEDSWKNILKQQGYEVEVWAHGLGELPAFQDLFVARTAQAVSGKYRDLMEVEL